MLEVIKSPWESIFVGLLRRAREKVYLASPFIKQTTAQLITANTEPNIDVRYINSFKLSNFHRGASDLEALRILEQKRFKQKNVHNLHAKIFIFDNTAMITSANLTPGGLRNNLEYGILLQNDIVEEINRDYLSIFENPDNPEITLEIIEKAENILNALPQEKK